VPKTVKEALELDKKNGNTLWADAIAKEMKDVCVAFKILPDGQSAPIGYQKIPCHMIFDMNGDVQEAIPHNMPEPLGKDLDVCMFCDSDHAGEKRTRRSRTGFLIFCNMALIDWISKKQATIETSVFGAEFVATKHGIEKLRGLRYKLCMMGIPLTGLSYIYGDNKSKVTNSTRPESTLKRSVTLEEEQYWW
jgi:hypothetical protein